jgi:hypothetical protein
MRRVLVLAFSAAPLICLLPSAATAGPAIGRGEYLIGHRGGDIVPVGSRHYGHGCCATGPSVYTYPSGPTYTFGGPHYFNSNLYYYRNYYPYPAPPSLRAKPRWHGRGIMIVQ